MSELSIACDTLMVGKSENITLLSTVAIDNLPCSHEIHNYLNK